MTRPDPTRLMAHTHHHTVRHTHHLTGRDTPARTGTVPSGSAQRGDLAGERMCDKVEKEGVWVRAWVRGGGGLGLVSGGSNLWCDANPVFWTEPCFYW